MHWCEIHNSVVDFTLYCISGLRPEMQLVDHNSVVVHKLCTLHHNSVVVQYTSQAYGLRCALQALRPEVAKRKVERISGRSPEMLLHPQALRPEVFIYQLSFQKESWSKKSIRNLRPYGLRCFNWSSPYGLDQYTPQALRPEVSKEKKTRNHLNRRLRW